MPGVRRFVMIKMERILIGIVLLIATYGFGYSASNVIEGGVVPDGWKRVSACGISFLVPASVENLNARGTDSCVAAFGDSDMGISIDYGMYSTAYKKHEVGLEGEIKRFRQGYIRVGGKRAQVVTYLDVGMDRRDPHLQYFAGMHVVVNERVRPKSSLNMTVAGRSEREQELAKRIFWSVRFQK
jgi:hypothetical protein